MPLTKPSILKRELVYKGFHDLWVDTLSLPGKNPIEYTILTMARDAAVVLAVTKEGKFLINREYRHPTRRYLFGLPGGQIDDGEEPLHAAKRELEEETGYRAKEVLPLGIAHPFPAVCNQRIHYYLAIGAESHGNTRKEPYELMETLELSKKEIFEKVAQGEEADSILLAALAFYGQSL